MFSRIAEWVRFHRGARAALAGVMAASADMEAAYAKHRALFRDLLAAHEVEKEKHRQAKADLKALRTDLADAKERAFWLEAENRDLRAKGGLKPKGDPIQSPQRAHPLPWETQS